MQLYTVKNLFFFSCLILITVIFNGTKCIKSHATIQFLGKTEFIQRHHFDEKYFLYIDFIALFSLSYFKYNKTTCAFMNLNVEFEFCKVLLRPPPLFSPLYNTDGW